MKPELRPGVEVGLGLQFSSGSRSGPDLSSGSGCGATLARAQARLTHQVNDPHTAGVGDGLVPRSVDRLNRLGDLGEGEGGG